MRGGAVLLVLAVGVLGGCGEASTPAASTTSSSPVPTTSAPPGDMAPHQGENNAWKQTGEVSPADRATAEQAVKTKIEPTLARLRSEGDLSVDTLQLGMADAGYREIEAQSLADRTSLGDPPPGAAFGIAIGDTACVVGTLQQKVEAPQITGRGGSEFTCLPPFTH